MKQQFSLILKNNLKLTRWKTILRDISGRRHTMCKGVEIHLNLHGLLLLENTELGGETIIQAEGISSRILSDFYGIWIFFCRKWRYVIGFYGLVYVLEGGLSQDTGNDKVWEQGDKGDIRRVEEKD